jgi:hypothetical protein
VTDHISLLRSSDMTVVDMDSSVKAGR